MAETVLNEIVARPVRGGYGSYLAAVFEHALMMTLRRRGVILAAGLALSPVLIPIALAFLSATAFAQDGNRIFVELTETLYLKALAPLLALFFGCMLIGEDVELQTLPYLLTRPLPRSALVLGRFAAYLLTASVILAVSETLVFAGCTSIGGLSWSRETVVLLGHYEVVTVTALLSYGALAVFLGAITKHPIVVGILFIFGWQRMAWFIPGMVDFLTLEKYLMTLLPKLATERQNPVIRTALADIEKQQWLVTVPTALAALAAITAAFLVITLVVVRLREYSAARSVAG